MGMMNCISHRYNENKKSENEKNESMNNKDIENNSNTKEDIGSKNNKT